MLAEVEERVVLQQRILKAIRLQIIDSLIRRDSSAAVHGTTRIRQLHLEVALVLGLRRRIAYIVVVVQRDVVVVALNQPSRWRVIVIGGQGKARVLGDLK